MWENQANWEGTDGPGNYTKVEVNLVGMRNKRFIQITMRSVTKTVGNVSMIKITG